MGRGPGQVGQLKAEVEWLTAQRSKQEAALAELRRTLVPPHRPTLAPAPPTGARLGPRHRGGLVHDPDVVVPRA